MARISNINDSGMGSVWRTVFLVGNFMLTVIICIILLGRSGFESVPIQSPSSGLGQVRAPPCDSRPTNSDTARTPPTATASQASSPQATPAHSSVSIPQVAPVVSTGGRPAGAAQPGRHPFLHHPAPLPPAGRPAKVPVGAVWAKTKVVGECSTNAVEGVPCKFRMEPVNAAGEPACFRDQAKAGDGLDPRFFAYAINEHAAYGMLVQFMQSDCTNEIGFIIDKPGTYKLHLNHSSIPWRALEVSPITLVVAPNEKSIYRNKVPCRSIGWRANAYGKWLYDKSFPNDGMWWEPIDCQYRRFSAPELQKCLKGKTLNFVGDSYLRNLMIGLEEMNGEKFPTDRKNSISHQIMQGRIGGHKAGYSVSQVKIGQVINVLRRNQQAYRQPGQVVIAECGIHDYTRPQSARNSDMKQLYKLLSSAHTPIWVGINSQLPFRKALHTGARNYDAQNDKFAQMVDDADRVFAHQNKIPFLEWRAMLYAEVKEQRDGGHASVNVNMVRAQVFLNMLCDENNEWSPLPEKEMGVSVQEFFKQ